MGYLANFMVYTFAMVGVIVIALLVFKQSTSGGAKSSKHLKLIDTMSLGQRKMLYIVSTGREKFLIAGDTDRTTLISKLESSQTDITNPVQEENIETISKVESSFKKTLSSLAKPSFMDKSNLGIKSSLLNQSNSKPIMKSLAQRISK
jgi:flagellar biogenesis protein FliO